MSNAEFLQSIIIVVTFLVAVFVISNFLRKSIIRRKTNGIEFQFNIISRLPLTNKSFLYIVQVGKNFLLIGASDNQVSALADITKLINNNLTETTSTILKPKISNPNPRQVQSFSFKDFLKETFKKSKN
ncbi:MAG: flagellar biosynthetic protein FliO [Ignavibacteria bacterium]|nr:flagellar biosynthetic protein FliO [Ignavibacteria bacterium]